MRRMDVTTRPLKQLVGSNNCVAVTAAMATGCLPEDFENRWGNVSPYSDEQFLAFMLELGYGLAVGAQWVPKEFDPKESVINIKVDLEKFAAYVVVKSLNVVEQTHALYWDGKQLFDPSPDIPNGKPWDFYDIVLIFPFTKIPEGLMD